MSRCCQVNVVLVSITTQAGKETQIETVGSLSHQQVPHYPG